MDRYMNTRTDKQVIIAGGLITMQFELTQDTDNTIIIRSDAKFVILFSFALNLRYTMRQDSSHSVPLLFDHSNAFDLNPTYPH